MVGELAGGGVIIEAAEGIEVRKGVSPRAVDLFRRKGEDAAEEGGLVRRRIEAALVPGFMVMTWPE